MKLSKAFISAFIILAAATVAQAETTTKVITDFNQPGEWSISKWSSADGRIAIRPNVPAALQNATPPVTESLGVKINWPGGEGFRIFSLQPQNEIRLPSGITEFRVWIEGSQTKHFCELILQDADGKRQKVGLGKLTHNGWKQYKHKVAVNLRQPLTITAVTFHDWGNPEPGENTAYITRLEAVVDSSAASDSNTTAANSNAKDQW